jgi:hypothetical protein
VRILSHISQSDEKKYSNFRQWLQDNCDHVGALPDESNSVEKIALSDLPSDPSGRSGHRQCTIPALMLKVKDMVIFGHFVVFVCITDYKGVSLPPPSPAQLTQDMCIAQSWREWDEILACSVKDPETGSLHTGWRCGNHAGH